VPVTVKMRMGWDHDSLNAPELARIAEDLGVKMITVHGRTRNQMYKGMPTGLRPQGEGRGLDPGDRQRRHLQIEDAAKALEQSGADGRDDRARAPMASRGCWRR
jgi:tRNA-dihydrouridine synthase B